MPRAVIIGASSGIGAALAQVLAREGYDLGLAARRDAMLQALQATLPTRSWIAHVDVSQPAEARSRFDALLATMGGVDLVILSSGIGITNPELAWELEARTIDVNVSGFVALATAACRHFRERGGGHLVGISSVAGIRGSRWAPAYAASKAFVTNYLEGVRALARSEGWNIAVTDIRPGFVETPMTQGQAGMFWVASAEKAAEQIYQAIRAKRSHAYITHRWALIASLLRHLPDSLLTRI